MTMENHHEMVAGGGVLLVDCYAPWCNTCAQFMPVFEACAERHPQHRFAKLDTEAQAGLRDAMGIEHLPTVILYRDGLLLFAQAGSFSGERLDDVISQAEGLDMNVVRAQVAADRGKTPSPTSE
jgi:thioredoxin 1